jgi:hypothetical protein
MVRHSTFGNSPAPAHLSTSTARNVISTAAAIRGINFSPRPKPRATVTPHFGDQAATASPFDQLM